MDKVTPTYKKNCWFVRPYVGPMEIGYTEEEAIHWVCNHVIDVVMGARVKPKDAL